MLEYFLAQDLGTKPVAINGFENAVKEPTSQETGTFTRVVRGAVHDRTGVQGFVDYFLFLRWTRVRRNSLRCFFLAIRLRRFLITEPI